jgi:predicted enzyme related to lactoylglutathione lyase
LNDYEVKGQITWLYYNDLQKAVDFYTDVMGFTLEVDQGWSKIFRIREGAFVGLVDGNYGYHKASLVKPVILCLNVCDADAWHKRLQEQGILLEMQPKESERLRIKVFMLKDPEGYVIEIQESLPGALSI